MGSGVELGQITTDIPPEWIACRARWHWLIVIGSEPCGSSTDLRSRSSARCRRRSNLRIPAWA